MGRNLCYSVLVHCNTNFFAIEFQCTSMFLASKLGKAKILIAKYAVTSLDYSPDIVARWSRCLKMRRKMKSLLAAV